MVYNGDKLGIRLDEGGIFLELHLLCGRAASGKSRRVEEEIARLYAGGLTGRVILIVPDQYTFEAERSLASRIGRGGLFGVEVLSFSRLVHRVLTLTGGGARTFIDGTGKSILLRRIMHDHREELKLYGSMADQRGFAPKLAEALSDLKRFEVSPAQLQEMAASLDPASPLYGKLVDMALIKSEFEEYLSHGFADGEDRMSLFIRQLSPSGFLDGAHVFIDGFEMLTEQIYEAINQILLCSQSLTVTLRLEQDENAPDSPLFEYEQRLRSRLLSIAGDYKAPVTVEWLQGCRRDSAPALQHLERELFAYGSAAFAGEIAAIELLAAQNPECEVEHLAARCVQLAQSGYRWRDIAVACNDLSSYGSLIKRVFARYAIPVFLDLKRPLIDHPAVQFISAALNVCLRRFAPADVLCLVKTGFSGLSADEAESFENHVLKHGVKYNKFKLPFEDADVEAVRDKLITPLLELDEGLKAPSCSSKCRALYDYLMCNSLPERLESFRATLEERDMREEAAETAQVWDHAATILSQMDALFGQGQISLKSFANALQSGFESVEVGVIPTTADQVLAGDISRTMSHPIQALLVLGVNDGVLPGKAGGDGLLIEEELAALEGSGIHAGRRRDECAAQERMDIYAAFSKPTRLLYLSWSAGDGEGRASAPSLLIERIKGIFPGIQIRSAVTQQDQAPPPISPGGSFSALVDSLRGQADGIPASAEWWHALRWYQDSPKWKGRLDSCEQALFFENNAPSIGSEQAKRLYSSTKKLSVSRMESYAYCPFKHFVQYGLRPEEREEFGARIIDMGSYLHRGMELFVDQVAADGLDWHSLDEGKCNEITDSVAQALEDDPELSLTKLDARHRYLARRLKRTLSRSIRAAALHIQTGDFLPLGAEITFGRDGQLPPLTVVTADGKEVLIDGKIDRADVCTDEGESYLRIVDYKSGSTAIDWPLLELGIRLQLIIYMDALLQNAARLYGLQDVHFGGLFYFRLDDPVVEGDEALVTAVQKELRRRFRMGGLVLKDAEVIRKMGEDNITASLNKDGSIGKNAERSVADEAEANALIRFARQKAAQAFTGIYDGDIRIAPLRKGGERISCKQCAYHALCAFDMQFPGNRDASRPLRKLGRNEFFDSIGSLTGGEGT